MEHRHLLPDELELLADGEEGFGTAPLLAHVERCEACRLELVARRRVVDALDDLPHFTPSPLFAYKVMKNVQVFEPWHVTALDTTRRFLPQSRLGRVIAGVTAGAAGLTTTLFATWLAFRFDTAVFVFNIVMARVREIALGVTSSLGSGLLGESASATIRANGATPIVIASSVLFLLLIGAAFGLRRVAAASRRRRA